MEFENIQQIKDILEREMEQEEEVAIYADGIKISGRVVVIPDRSDGLVELSGNHGGAVRIYKIDVICFGSDTE